MLKHLERALGHKILSSDPVRGGSISDSFKVQTSNGHYFCKLSQTPTSVFREEATGLKALVECDAIRVPRVFYADDKCLVLEWIDSATATPEFWADFGKRLAELHSNPYTQFGFRIDNHIGGTPQKNPQRSIKEISWAEYFIEFRLKPMITHQILAVEQLLQLEWQKALPKIRAILSEVKEPPSLVHGDLWNGNYLCSKEMQPVLIDPAPYFGHREVDIAMSELFGGFSREFYVAYEEVMPLQPGFEKRKDIYNLYHMLNHWILFGGSYRTQCMELLKSVTV